MGNYVTNIRTSIDGIFYNSKECCFSALDIENVLTSRGIEHNKTTVYRYLNHLVEEKMVLKFYNEDNRTVMYKYNEKGRVCESHLHLQCEKCGKIEHLDCGEMGDFFNHIVNHHGYKLDFSKSILYGLCKECQNEK